MRYAMLIIGEEGDWSALSPAEVDAEIGRIYVWLEKWSAKIDEGGAELDSVKTAKTIRGGVVTDGPFIEAKEVVGGIIFLHADTIDEAAAIAAEWPGVDSGRTTIEVRPTIIR
ncbi:MAG TPA: YciI family protein [Actinomycetes bacterium]|jgi:hypothetical protein